MAYLFLSPHFQGRQFYFSKQLRKKKAEKIFFTAAIFELKNFEL